MIPNLNVQLKKIIITALLSIVIYMLIGAFTINFNSHNKWGDNWTTMLTMYSGKEFSEHGFINQQFTPRIPAGPGKPGEVLYTHFPPLPYYLVGILYSLGICSLSFIKLINAFLAALAIAGIFTIAARLFKYFLAILVVIASVFLAISYVQLSSTPMVLGDALSIWGVFFLFLAIEKGDVRRSYFTISWVLFFLSAWSTFENILWFQIISTAVILWKIPGWNKRILLIFIVGISPVIMFIMHFSTNTWAFGSFQRAFEDFLHAFLWRTQDLGKGTNYFESIAGGAGNYPFWLFRQVLNLYGLLPFYNFMFTETLRQTFFPVKLSLKLLFAFWPLISCFLALFITWISTRHQDNEQLKLYFKALLILMIADFSFWLIFQQLTTIHIYRQVGRHWIPTYSFLIGGSIFFSIKQIVPQKSSWSYRILMGALLFSLLPIPVLNAVTIIRTAETLRNDDYKTSLSALKKINAYVSDQDLILTDNKKIVDAAFIHQPRNAFGLHDAVFSLNTSEVEFTNFAKENISKLQPHFLFISHDSYLKYLIFDTATFSKYNSIAKTNLADLYQFSSYREPASNPQEIFKDLAPQRTAVSFEDEQLAHGPYSGNYGSKLKLIIIETEIGISNDSNFCFRIEGQVKSKSGVETRKQPFIFFKQGKYLISFYVLSHDNLSNIKAALVSNSEIYWASAPASTSLNFSNIPGTWTQLLGVLNIPDDLNNAFIFIISAEKMNKPIWYIDNIKLQKIDNNSDF